MVLEMDEPIRYPYWVEFDDLMEQTFQYSLNPITLKFLPAIPPSKPDWSKLQFHQCHNSPLGTDVAYCPVAVNLAHMVEGFKGRNPTEKANVAVEIKEGRYQNRLDLQKGFGCLMGGGMVTSNCPV